MSRVNLLLLLAVLASAIYLVNVQYQSRRLFSELERANAQGRRLALEQERLLLLRRAQATSARIERLAREKLNMRAVTPAITVYVNPGPGASSSAAPREVQR